MKLISKVLDRYKWHKHFVWLPIVLSVGRLDKGNAVYKTYTKVWLDYVWRKKYISYEDIPYYIYKDINTPKQCL